MAIGDTITTSLANSLDTIRSSARVHREQVGVMSQLVSQEKLDMNTGQSWSEVKLGVFNAQRIQETTDLKNPQRYSDSVITITPTMVGVHTVVTDKVKQRLNKKVLAKMGSQPQDAIQRLKDEDGLLVLALGATTCSPGAGNPLTSGHVAAAKFNLSSNTTERAIPPFCGVFHGFQIKDLFDELVAGVGTYVVSEGLTASVFQKGFTLPIASVEIYEDGNITIDSGSDATGGVFPREGIVLVQGAAPKMTTERKEGLGGGAEVVYHYDEYAYGLRNSTTWLQTLISDAAAPTS